MESFNKIGDAETPSCDFNPKTGVMKLQGRSIPKDADAFWNPLLSWFYAYAAEPAPKTVFEFKLIYFNNASSKKLFYLLNKLQAIYNQGIEVEVVWFYAEEDDFMLEVGNDFKSFLNVPFQLVPINELFVVETVISSI